MFWKLIHASIIKVQCLSMKKVQKTGFFQKMNIFPFFLLFTKIKVRTASLFLKDKVLDSGLSECSFKKKKSADYEKNASFFLHYERQFLCKNIFWAEVSWIDFSQCGKKENLLSYFFDKNFVKLRILLQKLLKIRFHEKISFCWEWIFRFFTRWIF